MWRVLLVDDSALTRNAMHAALEPYGLEIGHADNGELAVAKASASHWDLIFLDVVMPIMDGPTALREIRSRGNTTPVVLVTSVSTATVVASALKLGGVSYIGKPFTPAHIRAVATKLLKLDPAVLSAPPRALLQHSDRAVLGRLRKLLPAHVAIDSSPTLAHSLDLAEATPYELVIIEPRDLADEIITVANVLRRALPAAGIFALSSEATAASLWRPDEGLDGTLPHIMDEAVGRGFLYANFLRPLVAIDGLIARIAGFPGPASQLAAYQTMVARVLSDRWSRLGGLVDLRIDVTRLPADPDVVVAVIDAVSNALRTIGAAPSFHVSPAVHAETASRLADIVII